MPPPTAAGWELPRIPRHYEAQPVHAPFLARHLGPGAEDQLRMLDDLGVASLEALASQVVPADLLLPPEASLGPGPRVRLRVMSYNLLADSLVRLGLRPPRGCLAVAAL